MVEVILNKNGRKAEPMNINSAKRAEEFVNILRADKKGRITRATVPGHKGKMYAVTIRRSRGVMTSTCVTGGEECQGNKHNLCYHTIAALLASGNRGVPKVKLAFCDTEEHAQNLANLGGRYFPLRSAQSGKEAWVVASLVESTTEMVV